MLQEMQKRMEEFHMVSPGDRILVGVSGGEDSVCLLLLLLALQKELGISLEVVHVEHGIRGVESQKDADFVEDMCKRYQLTCHKVEVDVPAYCTQTGLGVEEAARILRYQVFAKLAVEKEAKIALAHHQEDNAETILFQLVRGSSLTGVCGMQPVRKDENGVCYIRPLLFFHRREIEDFLKRREELWCVDATNAELEYSRNYLRGRVIPELEKINSQAVEHINQTAFHLSEVKNYLDYETEKMWQEYVSVGERLMLDAKGIQELHPVMQRELAYKAIIYMAKRKKDISSTHVADLLSLCKGQSGKQINLPYGLVARKSFETVYIERLDEDSPDEMMVYEVSGETLKKLFQSGETLELKLGNKNERLCCRIFKKNQESLEIPRKTYTKWFGYDKIENGFCIRTRRSGDYFITDDAGHRKKLKTYFIDEKIPVEERGKRWLLAQNQEVLWLIGGRISEHIKVSHMTNYIFEITYDGGSDDE